MPTTDPRLAYDATREAPLAQRDGRWHVCRHADVVAVAHNPHGFSSGVSRFLQVPNGLDGEAHTAYRRLLDPFFSPERMDALRPTLEEVAAGVLDGVSDGATTDAVADLGARYAVRAQSAWLGWPASLEQTLLAWMDANHSASRSGDPARTAAVAAEFNTIIRGLLDPRRDAGEEAPDDLTTELVQLRAASGHQLSDEVLVSVLRNWTGGDLGSIALCVGVVLHWLATHPDHVDHLRFASDGELAAVIDEILRLDDPFVSNRRRVLHDAEVGGTTIPAGDLVVLNWTAANRDPRVFGEDEFNPDGHAGADLVYGTGPHVCPGRPLATLELVVLLRTVLDRWDIALAPGSIPEREQPPVGGFGSVPLVLVRR